MADTGDWLQAIEDWLGPKGHGFKKIYIHTTGEESHFQGAKYDAWLGFLAFVSGNRGPENWPHVFTSHSFNTEEGQREALARGGIDLPALGMFHGVRTDPNVQIQQAKDAGKPFLFYGVRGRLVPGFYLWKAGAQGSFHEWYNRFEGALNNDWDNPQPLLHEGPGWNNAHYSQKGEMVGSWMWEEIREGIDDDAYMTTLEHWIDVTAGDSRPDVVAARNEAVETLEDVRSQIDVVAGTGMQSPEDDSISPGVYARVGLNMIRAFADRGKGFDRLRRKASDATSKLVLVAAEQSPAPAATENEEAAGQP